MESRTVIKLVEAVGWYEVGHEGSHKPFQHPTRRGKVTVPHPKKDIPIGTVRSIMRQAGWEHL